MMVFTTKALADAGLSFELAKALLAPAEGEIVVHIHQCLDGDPVPQEPRADLDMVTPRPGSHRETSPGMESDATDQRSVYTPSTGQGGNTDKEQMIDLPDEDARRRPATLADFATPHDGLGRNVPLPAVVLDGRDANRSGIRLPEHGAILGDVRALCHVLRLVVEVSKDGRCMLSGAFGCKTFPSLDDAAAALNRRSWT